MDKELLLSRISDLCKERNISMNTAFVESGVGKNFKSNLKTSNPTMGKITMLAVYFGVSVNYFLDEKQEKNPSSKVIVTPFPLTPHETAVVIAYRNHPNEQPIIDKILDVPADENNTQLYKVAYFGENGSEGIISIPKDEWERLKNLPTTDQNLS